MGYSIGIVGLGEFSPHFVPLFQAHPLVDRVALAELRPQVLGRYARQFGIDETYPSFEEMLASDLDAVAIFTQRWAHAPMATAALKAGKHVYSAVPAAVTLDELGELVKTVEETGLTYALGETSYYRPPTIYCRNRFRHGDFGEFVYGEGHYYHDMSHFYSPYYGSNGDEWKRFASFPPMLYPTHSVSHVLGVTFSRMTHVSCLGWRDNHVDGIFRADLSAWGNEFSNQTALFRTADGGMARVNEFRRSAAGESRMTIVGTRAAYEEQPGMGKLGEMRAAAQAGIPYEDSMTEGIWCQLVQTHDNPVDGEFDYTKPYMEKVKERVPTLHVGDTGVEITEVNKGTLPPEYIGRRWLGVSPHHPIHRLPCEYVGMTNRHAGSHAFLVVDFLEAMDSGKLAPNNVWISARYNAPGIVAHESSRRDGEMMPIPDFGTPPRGAEMLEPGTELR